MRAKRDQIRALVRETFAPQAGFAAAPQAGHAGAPQAGFAGQGEGALPAVPRIRQGLNLMRVDLPVSHHPHMLHWLGLEAGRNSVCALAGNNHEGGRSGAALAAALAAAGQGLRILLVEGESGDSMLGEAVANLVPGWRNRVALNGFLASAQGIDLALDDGERGPEAQWLKRILRLSGRYDGVIFDGVLQGQPGAPVLYDAVDRVVLVRQQRENTSFLQRAVLAGLYEDHTRFGGILELMQRDAPVRWPMRAAGAAAKKSAGA